MVTEEDRELICMTYDVSLKYLFITPSAVVIIGVVITILVSHEKKAYFFWKKGNSPLAPIFSGHFLDISGKLTHKTDKSSQFLGII